jgi:hypothetical protein
MIVNAFAPNGAIMTKILLFCFVWSKMYKTLAHDLSWAFFKNFLQSIHAVFYQFHIRLAAHVSYAKNFSG